LVYILLIRSTIYLGDTLQHKR